MCSNGLSLSEPMNSDVTLSKYRVTGYYPNNFQVFSVSKNINNSLEIPMICVSTRACIN